MHSTDLSLPTSHNIFANIRVLERELFPKAASCCTATTHIATLLTTMARRVPVHALTPFFNLR
jgi:hypothetical protein